MKFVFEAREGRPAGAGMEGGSMIDDVFGPPPVKREGAVMNPDSFTFECDLDKCEECRTKYLAWRKAYRKQEGLPEEAA